MIIWALCNLAARHSPPSALRSHRRMHAAELNADWHAVQRRIENIRKRFSALDSDGGSASAENEESPLLISARDAASMCGRSERTWRTWDSAGWLPFHSSLRGLSAADPRRFRCRFHRRHHVQDCW
jgi:hypothetical protein